MEQLELIVERKKVMDHLHKLWKSEPFKNAMKDSYSFIYKFCQKVSDYPIIFFQYTDYKIERPHFSAWFNAIPYRHYDNPVQSDLYYFHELYHRNTLKYFPFHLGDFDFFSWMEKMKNNEIEASIYSEVLIYFILPELRPQSFKDEIWADRFLQEKVSVFNGFDYPDTISKLSNQTLYNNHFPYFVSGLINQRRKNVMTDAIHLKDPIEKRNKAYDRNNIQFMWIWERNAVLIENAMSEFYNILRFEKDRAINDVRKYALDKLVDFLSMHQLGNDPCPFYKEAKSFAEVFYAFQETYQFLIYDKKDA